MLYFHAGYIPPFLTDGIAWRDFFPGLEDKSLVFHFIVWKGGTEALCCHLSPPQTLDRLPLTNPEHFGTPVIGKKGNRGRRSNPMWVSSSGSVHPAGLISNLMYQVYYVARKCFLYQPTAISNRLPHSTSADCSCNERLTLISIPLTNSPWGLKEESLPASSSSLIMPGCRACVHAG